MIKLIVSDLDGTLLQKGLHIQERDREALHQAAEAGIQLCFASGRMHPEIVHVAKELKLKAHSVSQNGAYLHSAEGQLLAENTFEPPLIKELATAAATATLVTFLCAPDYYVVAELSESNAHMRDNLLAPLHIIPHAIDAAGSEFACGKMTYVGDMGELLVLQKRLLSAYGERIDAYISADDCLDIMPKQVSKGTGILALQRRLGILPEETVCVGDSFNDVPMFKVTPHSFAMAGSLPELKAQAAHVTPSVADTVLWALRAPEDERAAKKAVL